MAIIDVFLSYVTCRASAYGMSRGVNCIRTLIVIWEGNECRERESKWTFFKLKCIEEF